MKKYRILLLTHKTLVPPEDLRGLSETKVDDFRTEYDVRNTLRRVGHDVRVVGVGDHLTELSETIDEWRPHVVFNLLDEFQGIISHDHYVVAYLELIQQRYTGCNPRGMMLARDKGLSKELLAYHRISVPRCAVSSNARHSSSVNSGAFVGFRTVSRIFRSTVAGSKAVGPIAPTFGIVPG